MEPEIDAIGGEIGYLHPLYPQSLVEWGKPRLLSTSGGWILERSIPSSPFNDAMGCYPLFFCRRWDCLADDLQAIKDELVSLALVADPFGCYEPGDLQDIFDHVIPFKDHYIADLQRPINEIASRHHRYYARKCLETVQVEICEQPIQHLDEWVNLYSRLSQRIGIRGMRAFSRPAFEKQLLIPGLVMFRALQDGETIGASICMLQGETAYGHLMGINETGQRANVSYGLYWTHLSYLADKVRWLDWGGTSGLQGSSQDGLSQFKRGWSTETRTAYFCGKIFNSTRYEELVHARAVEQGGYFPAYRQGEMG